MSRKFPTIAAIGIAILLIGALALRTRVETESGSSGAVVVAGLEHPVSVAPAQRATIEAHPFDSLKLADVSESVSIVLANDQVFFASDTPAQRAAAKIQLQGERFVLIEESADDGPVYAVIDLAESKIVGYVPIGAYQFRLSEDAFGYIDPADRILIYRKDWDEFLDIHQWVLGDTETFNSLTDYIPMFPFIVSTGPHTMTLGVFTACYADSSCGSHAQRRSANRTVTLYVP